MSATTLGRRYERLLFLAAPLSLLCLILLFVALATTSQQERVTAKCFSSGATALEEKQSELADAFKGATPPKANLPTDISYKLALGEVFIHTFLGSSCYQLLSEQVDKRYRQDPKAIISSLRQEASKLAAGPIAFRGIELPEKATVNLFGTDIKIELMTFVQLLQAGLAPLLLLWIGSLYGTRYRESLLVGSASSISDIFPHIVNIYPAVRYPQPRKRSYVQPYLPHMFNLLYAVFRIGLLMIFVVPTAVAYVFGIVLLEGADFRLPFLGLSVLVGIFTLGLVLAELLPWHYTKTFPGPPLVQPKQ